MNTAIKVLSYSVLFVIFTALIINGHSQQSTGHLFRMFAGLSGLIILLWIYNRKYK
ncbi:MAG: hypothetical protein Q4D53_07075 [Leptotrichiaceae bacterium]|nr:hypothetical protein [Leptotrichiaceae bacterium]